MPKLVLPHSKQPPAILPATDDPAACIAMSSPAVALPAPVCIVPCANNLGEGVIWNHLRRVVMWFDITARRFYTYAPHAVHAGNTQQYQLPVMASAAMLTNNPDKLLFSSERGIELFSFTDGTVQPVFVWEGEATYNRSNDGKGAPDGSFWVSSMHKTAAAATATGALYRVYAKTPPRQITPAALKAVLQVEQLKTKLKIPNALCFNNTTGYFTDTPTQIISRIETPATVTSKNFEHRTAPWLHTQTCGGNPDGATLDADGRLWNARWGNGEVHVYDISRAAAVTPLLHGKLPCSQPSCVAFGAASTAADAPLDTLYITTAREKLSAAALATEPLAGGLFVISLSAQNINGVTEPVFAQTSPPSP